MSVRLRFLSPAGEEVVPLDGPMVVGRDESCDVTIDSVRLSRHHATFTPDAGTVEVTDLESRNGVIYEGERVESVKLGVGGRVVLGDVSVTVVGAEQPAVTPPLAPPVDDGQTDLDHTTLLPALGGDRGGEGAGADNAMDDQTTLLPSADIDTMLQQASPVAPPPQPARRPAGKRDTQTIRQGVGPGFGGRLIATMLLLAGVIFTVTAVPLLLERRSEREIGARARTATLARLLASENERLLSAGARLSATLGPVAEVGGVRAARVISADGRVLAPVEELDEVVTDLEGFGDIRQLRGLTERTANGMFEAAVAMDDSGRWLGVAWVRFDPVQAAGGRAAGSDVLAVAFGLALVLGLAGTLAIRRMITSRLETFATEVELAVADPAARLGSGGLPGMPKVVEAVDYLLQRLRAGGDGGKTPLAAVSPGSPHHPVSPSPRAQARPAVDEGLLVLDSGFVVRSSDARARALIGAGGTSVDGQHILEAVADQLLVTGIIDCVSGLSEGGDGSQAFEPPVGNGVGEIVATRTSDGNIQLVVRPA